MNVGYVIVGLLIGGALAGSGGSFVVGAASGALIGFLLARITRPDQLVFLAQGSPPFELLTGRALDAPEHFPQETLLGDSAIFRMLRDSGQAGVATLGPRLIATGLESLEISPRRTWRVALLWAGLLGAIAGVDWLVYSLMREMKQS